MVTFGKNQKDLGKNTLDKGALKFLEDKKNQRLKQKKEIEKRVLKISIDKIQREIMFKKDLVKKSTFLTDRLRSEQSFVIHKIKQDDKIRENIGGPKNIRRNPLEDSRNNIVRKRIINAEADLKRFKSEIPVLERKLLEEKMKLQKIII